MGLVLNALALHGTVCPPSPHWAGLVALAAEETGRTFAVTKHLVASSAPTWWTFQLAVLAVESLWMNK